MPPRRIPQNASPAPHGSSPLNPSKSSNSHYETRRSSASLGSSSASTGRLAERPELAPAVALLNRAFVPVAESRDRKVDLNSINQTLDGCFEFCFQWMDFYTGKVIDEKGNVLAAELYFRPAPVASVQAWIAESKPWGTRYDYVPSQNGFSRHKQARTAAWFVIDTIDSHARDTADDSDGAMSTHTSWACVKSPENDLLYQDDQKHADWRIRYVYRQSLNPVEAAYEPMPINPEKPHVIVSVIDGTPLEEGVLCKSELSTLLYFAGEASLKAKQRQHAIYPVMVVTASCDTVRITQAIWDIKKAQMEIRMTSIMEFPEGFWKRDTEYYHLLGWFLGDAVGTTR